MTAVGRKGESEGPERERPRAHCAALSSTWKMTLAAQTNMSFLVMLYICVLYLPASAQYPLLWPPPPNEQSAGP